MNTPRSSAIRIQTGAKKRSPRGAFPGLLLWVALSFVPAVGAWLWEPGAWYSSLEKPSWNPPAVVFGPVWTTLYLLMGIAAWRVWREGGFLHARAALVTFLVQLALNAAWTPVFFGLHAIGGALAVIIALWCAITATIALFWCRDRWAALLLLPYLAWVSFAATLNATLLHLNSSSG